MAIFHSRTFLSIVSKLLKLRQLLLYFRVQAGFEFFFPEDTKQKHWREVLVCLR